jgi:hypothetical protein
MAGKQQNRLREAPKRNFWTAAMLGLPARRAAPPAPVRRRKSTRRTSVRRVVM